MKKVTYIFLGCLAVALGAVGVVTPVLPTTPFLLLATFLFTRSSPRLNKYLLNNRIFGKFLTNYFENKPISVRSKLTSIAFLWLALGATFYFAGLSKTLIIILLIIGMGVTAHISMLGKYRRKAKKS
ncbi:MAG: YbaN family protein [Prevotellaceae bacterium]|jgi:uncharacterized membrane protein YbaN (DUF454 family)|nr:YbaN family protein [Prevotellaceae bacterium]